MGTVDLLFIKDQIITQLLSVKDDLNQLKDNYCIIGASGLILLDMEVGETSDIDILVSNRDAELLDVLWNKYKAPDFATKEDDLFISDFSRYTFNLLDIEIMGELRVKTNGVFEKLEIKEFIPVTLDKDFTVNIPTLEEYKKMLLLFGREKDLAKFRVIEKHLNVN